VRIDQMANGSPCLLAQVGLQTLAWLSPDPVLRRRNLLEECVSSLKRVVGPAQWPLD
jgi:hypothetical protein